MALIGATQVTKVFVLVVSLWGFTGDSWVFTGNQLVLQDKFLDKEACQTMGRRTIYEI